MTTSWNASFDNPNAVSSNASSDVDNPRHKAFDHVEAQRIIGPAAFGEVDEPCS